jgi:hypothetical protein
MVGLIEQVLKSVTQGLGAAVDAVHGFPIATAEGATDFFAAPGRK